MQTFLPVPDFTETARILDNTRLGNQCYRECLTLYNGGWPHHPAHKMWQPHLHSLCEYAETLALEMYRRKGIGEARWSFVTCIQWIQFWREEKAKHSPSIPPWLGDDRLHATHRACLLAKDFDYYQQFKWSETPTPPTKQTKNKWPYYWPV